MTVPLRPVDVLLLVSLLFIALGSSLRPDRHTHVSLPAGQNRILVHCRQLARRRRILRSMGSRVPQTVTYFKKSRQVQFVSKRHQRFRARTWAEMWKPRRVHCSSCVPCLLLGTPFCPNPFFSPSSFRHRLMHLLAAFCTLFPALFLLLPPNLMHVSWSCPPSASAESGSPPARDPPLHPAVY